MKSRKELAREDRPEVKVLERALSELTDVELLATFLGSGVKGANVKQIARELLKHGSRLLTVSASELTQIKGMGKIKSARFAALLELFCRLATGLPASQLRSELGPYLIREQGIQTTLFQILEENNRLKSRNPEIRFIDLFAGIGGIRLAFQGAGARCVWSCEWDKSAQRTYEANFNDTLVGDIREITGEEHTEEEIKKAIWDHEILCAGFPCQPFSLAGVSKKNSLGRVHGFLDKTQGTLFFDVARILKAKRPKAFFLENVKNLLHHDGGNTWNVIENTLRELGYVFSKRVVDAAKWVPQHRERIFIVGYDPDQISITKEEIIIPDKPEPGYRYPELKNIVDEYADPRLMLGPGTWATLERHKKHHQESGNGFGYGLHRLPIKEGEVTRTISARYHKDGAEILIETQNERPRRLSVKEACQLQGFDPATFDFPVSDTQAYRQIGNSVAVPAVRSAAMQIIKVLKERTK